jgi:hypothetical protein
MVHAAKVLVQILLSRETFACVTPAALKGAHQCCFGTAMLAMDLSLMPQETARVRETLELFALLVLATVRPIMLVHMLTEHTVNQTSTAICRRRQDSPPFTFAIESLHVAWFQIRPHATIVS